jgi:dienelactone hydrolase
MFSEEFMEQRGVMSRTQDCILAMLVTVAFAQAQTTGPSAIRVLSEPIQPVAVTAYQIQRYMMERIPRLPRLVSREQWTGEQTTLRRHILDDIAFHGWPREWVESPPRFEEVGPVENSQGYRWRKLRFEIVPGFWSTATLYEPRNSGGRTPAILYVEGHEHTGKAAEYAQKACINLAKRGIVTLDPEWLGMGELAVKQNQHDYAADLDLVGANALGLFYLAMRRGIDYLAGLPQVDPTRLGVTGLSGGGWQTIVLSALDPRVAVMVEVAGFGSLQSNITHPIDTDEIEETPPDFLAGEDYTSLVALRAPRPTLLIHNGEDNCCFRAMLVKPYIFDDLKPYFQIFEKEQNLAFYENRDPGTHNFQIDNRLQAYRFFSQHFHLPEIADEIPSGADLRSFDELSVGLPADNLTITGLAKKLALGFTRPSIPTAPTDRETWAATERPTLKTVIRYKPVTVVSAWRMWNTKDKGLETLSYRLDFSNGLSATGLWLKAIAVTGSAPATLVLNDQGRKAAGEVVSDRVNRDEQVLALDVVFNGEMVPQSPDPTDYELLVASIGDRPLGLEVGQLIGAARWLAEISGRAQIRLEVSGMRSQVVALVAAAIEPKLFSEVVITGGMHSLGFLPDAEVPLRSAPELFCLDLYKNFDLDYFRAMAGPTKISEKDFVTPVVFRSAKPGR